MPTPESTPYENGRSAAGKGCVPMKIIFDRDRKMSSGMFIFELARYLGYVNAIVAAEGCPHAGVERTSEGNPGTGPYAGLRCYRSPVAAFQCDHADGAARHQCAVQAAPAAAFSWWGGLAVQRGERGIYRAPGDVPGRKAAHCRADRVPDPGSGVDVHHAGDHR